MTQPIGTPRRTAPDAPSARRRPRSRVAKAIAPAGFNWRWVSLSIIVVTGGLLAFIATDPIFNVTSAEIGGATYTPVDEIFTAADISNKHILTIDPELVRHRVLASPSFSSAQVALAWPARVIIVVVEREPALVWEQGSERYWVDVNGNLMLMRRDLPNLVHVVNEGEAIPFECPGPACPTSDAQRVSIDPSVVLGAQQLKTLRSNIDVLYYDPAHGLSYQDGRGWRGYFGAGTDMDIKLRVYETLVSNLLGRGILPVRIDVSNPNAPYYGVAR